VSVDEVSGTHVCQSNDYRSGKEISDALEKLVFRNDMYKFTNDK